MLDVKKSKKQEEKDDFELEDSYLDKGLDDSFNFFDDDDDKEEDEPEGGGPKSGGKKFILIGVVLVLIIALVAAFFLLRGRGKEDENVVEDSPVYTEVIEEQPEVEEPPVEVNPSGLTDEEEQMYNAALGIGVQDLTDNDINQNDTPMTSGDFTKDYNSTDIPMFYEIKNIRTVNDYISYTKYRTSTADGVELYWLDGEYHGKPVRLTTTLQVFKELSASGVVPVLVEVTTTKDGNQLVTGFTVDTSQQVED